MSMIFVAVAIAPSSVARVQISSAKNEKYGIPEKVFRVFYQSTAFPLKSTQSLLATSMQMTILFLSVSKIC